MAQGTANPPTSLQNTGEPVTSNIATTSIATSSSSSAPIVQLYTTHRTTPIHPFVPHIKVASPSRYPQQSTGDPSTNTPPTQLDAARTNLFHPETTEQYLNPLTLQPLSTSDLREHGFASLQSRFLSTKHSREEILKERDHLAERLKQRIEERDRIEKEVDKQVDLVEKQVSSERKAFEMQYKERD